MTQSLRVQASKLDHFKWVLVVALFIGILFGNLHFSAIAWPIRASLMILITLVGLWLAKSTAQGQVVFIFLKSARQEMRKVVWPTRQETLQVTLWVMLIVLLMSVVLWAMDGLFALMISAIIS